MAMLLFIKGQRLAVAASCGSAGSLHKLKKGAIAAEIERGDR